ncbi:MAG: hypothetical protein IJ220_07890 [Clostridia bacterium]|nr:hypothetical protein [Clostridia bacterium]
MKQAWSDLKSFVTVAFTLTLIVLIVIVALKSNWDIFQIVFTLFSNVVVSVFTYYFTKKDNNENTENSTKNE